MEKYDVIEKLAKSIDKEHLKVWCDDDSFDASYEGFEYTQDVFGVWDETYEFVKECNGMSVVAWSWRDDYPTPDKMGKELPKLLQGDGENVYHKGTYNVWEWEANYKGYDCKVLKFRTSENYEGTEYYLFWYLVAFE